jgi:hypothetical protein
VTNRKVYIGRISSNSMSNRIELERIRGMEEIPGEFILAPDLASEALAEIGSRTHDREGSYGTNGIWLNGDKAVKAPVTPYAGTDRDFYAKGFAREIEVARSLKEGGVNVPEMFGIHISEDESILPFLVMERLNITDFDDLSPEEKLEARIKYQGQIKRAKDLGFEPLDTNYRRNSGFNRETQEVYLFDFEDWES